MAPKKTLPEPPLLPPIDFHPVSNGEFHPRPPGSRARRAGELWRRIVEDKHRRAGMTRREFAESACGMAAALYVANVTGCGSGSDATHPESADGGQHFAAPDGNVGIDAAGYDVTPDLLEDADRARERLVGDEFIVDVQTHVSTPLSPWTEKRPPERAADFISQIFVQSSTTVACVSGIPSIRNLGVAHVEAHAQLQAVIDRLGGPRAFFHANADPERGASELDYMAEVTGRFPVGAFKIYPHRGALKLDSDEVGGPFLDRATALGVRVVAAHRGISGGGDYETPGSPADVVRAAKNFPEVKFLVYHSGWEPGGDENHAFDPANPDQRGVDRFVQALIETGIGPEGNVYAELGSTWYNLLATPEPAAHVLGKLLRYLGPDRILWGTDCVFNGVPESQIAPFRTFMIPEALQAAHGYPALTDAVRQKIFGLNAAAVYGVDPAAVRYVIQNDDIEALRLAFVDDPRSIQVPDPKEYLGPRTRREFLAFLAREQQG